MFKEKEMIHFYKPILTLYVNIMDLFYLNGSLLFLQLNYRSNVPFSQKKKKSNLTEEKQNTIHNFADSVPFGTFLSFLSF